MKKLLTSLLALLTCFACATAVACGESGNNSSNDTGSSNTGSSDTGSIDEDDELQDAVDYLETLYKEQNVETRQDYEVLPAIMGYPITWTVDVASGVTINATADKVIVDVDELLDENLTYVLTATVADGDRTVTVSFTRVVLAAPAIIPVAITEAPVEGTAYKYHVYQSTLAQDMYFAGDMAATYYFKTTTNWEEGVDVYAEYVDGSTTDFYLYFVKDGANQYLGVKVSADGAHDNIIYGTEKVSTFVWNADLGTVTTHLEATKNNGGPNDFYFGNYGDKNTISCSYTSYAGGAGNNVGHLVTMVDRSTITPDVKVAESKAGLALAKTEFTGAAEVELPVARHADVAVEWAVAEHANASIVDGKLVLTNPAEDTTVTLTATLTCGEVSDTKEFTITLKHATEGPITTIAGALAGAEGAEATFSGTVSEIYQAWSDQYSNISFYVTDGTDTILVFRAGTKVVVGDEVTVTGTVTAYNGVNQIAQGATVTITSGGTETPPATVHTTIAGALAGAEGDTATFSGTVSEIYYAWSDTYNNMSFYVTDGTDTILVFRAGTKVEIGDEVSVNGTVTVYNGVNQIAQGATVTITSGGTETPPVVTPPAGDAITTIAGALAGAEGDKATFSGTVSEIYQAWNTQYSNMSFYVTDGTDRILVFRAGTQVEIGDAVTVDGTVTMYNEKPQIAQGATVTVTEKHVCSTFTEADCLNAAKCTVCDKVNGEALGHKDENSDNVCDRCNGNLATATVKASKTMAELITANGWTTSTTKQSFNLDEVVSVKVNGGSNTGKAYNGDHIRIYATDSPAGTLTISVAEGYELVSVKVTTSTGTYAFLCVDGTDVDISNVQTAVSGSSVVLNSVKNGSDGKQVRVLAIEVEYKPLG